MFCLISPVSDLEFFFNYYIAFLTNILKTSTSIFKIDFIKKLNAANKIATFLDLENTHNFFFSWQLLWVYFYLFILYVYYLITLGDIKFI